VRVFLIATLVTILLSFSFANVSSLATRQQAVENQTSNNNGSSSVEFHNRNSSQTSFFVNHIQPDKFLQSKGSFRPFLGGRPQLFAALSPIVVFSNNIRNDTRVLDFGQVPAMIPPDFMKFMPPYQVTFYVTNTGMHDINVSSVKVSKVYSTQTPSPFNFCGLDYNKTSLRLPAGYSQTFSICFLPNVTGHSNATIQFFGGPNLLFNIPISGNGITPSLSMLNGITLSGLSKRSINQANIDNNNVTNRIKTNNTGEIASPSSNVSSSGKVPSFLINTLSSCSVSIEGGGQRPDPAVDGAGPLNATPESPPDDGSKMNDTPLHHLHKINVGEWVKLNALVRGVPLKNVRNIQWKVDDPKIKDYNESIPGKFVTYNLTAQDYQKPAISLYWKDVGNKNVTVSVKATINNQLKNCSGSRTFVVERNHDDINRQAEDFYTFNHNATLLSSHLHWHVVNQPRPCDPLRNGEAFFVFHKGVISNFDAWRHIFGYPQIVAWDPATNPPQGVDMYDQNRNSTYQPQPIPSYYTLEGGRTLSRCAPFYHENITKLSEFKNANDLSSEVEPGWHGEVHEAIGGDTGDMSFFNLSPKDPVFWEWHKYIDLNIYDKYREVRGAIP
jgi:hypothetical protein